MNNNEPTLKGITSEFKNILLKTQRDKKARDERWKKYRNVHEMTKREYQNLYKETVDLKKKLEQYENYFKNHQKKKEQKGAKPSAAATKRA